MRDVCKMSFRIDVSIKNDFLRKIQELGYANPSEALRDSVEIITYNGERTPKEQVLAHHLHRIQDVMSAEEAEKLFQDFCSFMEEYHYLAQTARISEEEFMEVNAVREYESKFAQQFYHMHGYALIPEEIPELLRHYYHDARMIRRRREKVSGIVAARAEELDIMDILSPAEKEKLAKI